MCTLHGGFASPIQSLSSQHCTSYNICRSSSSSSKVNTALVLFCFLTPTESLLLAQHFFIRKRVRPPEVLSLLIGLCPCTFSPLDHVFCKEYRPCYRPPPEFYFPLGAARVSVCTLPALGSFCSPCVRQHYSQRGRNRLYPVTTIVKRTSANGYTYHS